MEFRNFQLLDAPLKNIVTEWYRTAQARPDEMYKFAELWMSFNGWGTCVTEQDSDNAMVMALSSETRLNEAFDALAQESSGFRDQLNNFVQWWPIYDARAYRKKAREYAIPYSFDRATFVANAHKWRIRHRPRNWKLGDPISWSHTLWTIYQVRCNFIHGQKGTNIQTDRDIVRDAFDVLSHFISESGCYEWG
jgi:hypothetical protein